MNWSLKVLEEYKNEVDNLSKIQCILLILPLAGFLSILSMSVSLESASCERIAFSSDRDGNWEIYVMDALGSNQVNVTGNPKDDWDPSWSPNGKQIAFVSGRDKNAEIYAMRANGSYQENLTRNSHDDLNPAWSPDGTRIAFVSDRKYWTGSYEIYVMNADGSSQVNVTNNPAWDSSPAWSPDGTRIAFTSNRDGNWEIYIMNANGSNARKLISSPVWDSEPAWSPDGEKIVFCSRRDTTPDIYVVNVDGSNLQRLTSDPFWDSNPAWSPDGKKIIFYSDRDGTPDIYVMNADGTNIERLTNDAADNWSPQWCCTKHLLIERACSIAVTNLIVLLFSLFFAMRKSISPHLVLSFMILLAISGFPSMGTPHSDDICSTCRHNIMIAENEMETVIDLMERAHEQGFPTPEIEAFIAEASEFLEKACTFCFHSRNCTAGNTLALRAYSILKESRLVLESLLDERKEEYAVYSAVIKEYTEGFGFSSGKYAAGAIQNYVIYDYTSVDRPGGAGDLKRTLEWVHEHIPEVEQETFDDFEVKNTHSYPLGNFFDLPARVILISSKEITEIFSKGGGYFELYAKYPFSQGVMGLSRVGFDAEMNQALVYVTNMQGYDCGWGLYMLLTKENGDWVVQDEICVWIS